MTFKNRFSKSEKVLSPKGVEKAQQQFKNDCDINSIMARFQKTGALDHVSRYQPQYGIASPNDYHKSMNIITRAQQMFDDLPSSLRNRFNGSPEELLEFVQNPENAKEADELGLALSDKAAKEAAVLAEKAAADAAAKVADTGAGSPGEAPIE